MSESSSVGAPSGGMVSGGRVSWFNLEKQFGFVELDDGLGDAFLHMTVLKAAGYYFVPRGTTVQVRVEPDRGKHAVVELLHVDTSTAREGEAPALLRKKRAERSEQHEREVEESQRGLRASIAETDRLVGQSEKMLKRHRQERDGDDAGEDGPRN